MKKAALVTGGKQGIDPGNARVLMDAGSLVDRVFLRG
jgi:hypothetical protein